jgi:23S rRNA (guanine2445-N2)-methyltransferase / 23S rRNA (guanine2069-N7)-methyltransferase
MDAPMHEGFPEPVPPPRPLSAAAPDEPPRLTARSLDGLEWVLARELLALGAVDLRVGRRTIEFGGSTEVLYRSVLESRTAIRVLEPLGRFEADSPESLYRGLRTIDWSRQIGPRESLRVDAIVHDTFLTHSLYAAQLVKDAIVDAVRTPAGVRPDVRLRGATLRVAMHLVGRTATIFRDAAGRSLHQRGWRVGQGEAPLSEVLAAGLLSLAGWVPGEPLVDPFCGSGTILIEAATAARGMAPGLWRARRGGHGFLRFHDCDRGLAERLLAELEARVLPPEACPGSFHASDLDPAALELAAANAEAAGVASCMTFGRRSFEEVQPQSERGLVATNPPYGERLPLPRAAALMRRIGDWLVARCGGWRAAVLAADTPAARHLGLHPRYRLPLANGPIACRLIAVEIRERSTGRGMDETDADASSDHHPLAGIRAPQRGWGGSGRSLDDQLGDFRRRLAKRHRHLARWARRQGIEAWRVYDRDIPEIPLTIDLYGGWLHACEYDRPHGRTDTEHEIWLDRLLEAAATTLDIPPNRTFLKRRVRTRGLSQVEKVGDAGVTTTVREGGLLFEVNLSDHLDTGLFLDHRTTRAMVRAEARGRRMLNLFCYTGSFSVYAAAGGAAETTSVDLSNTSLERTRLNLAANGFDDARRHRIVRDEARAFLSHRGRRGEEPFDLVVVDAPTFSRSARSETPWDVQIDHAGLLTELASQVAPGGIVYFSCNARRFRLDEGSLAPCYTIRDITARTIPEDFRSSKVHRAWRLVRSAAADRPTASGGGSRESIGARR